MIKNDASEKRIATTYLRCGDCYYFKKRHPRFEVACVKNGVLPKAVAPVCFVPNIDPLRKNGTHFLSFMNLVAGNLKPAQFRTLAALFNRESKLRSTGFSLFEKVFFYVTNPNYLSNYYSGHVLGIGGDKTELVVMGTLSTKTPLIIAHLFLEHVIPTKASVANRDELVRRQRLFDPIFTRTRFRKATMVDKAYEPPTLDMTLEELEAAAEKSKEARAQAPKTRGRKRRTPSITTALVIG